ncbi:AAA family ATPase [Cellulomonas sp. URHE0023]|uniref:AAA family ATPase n=1 Tax=Cellulomonas sp. URHE0023 TaxID=1380354 RepID=UPI00047FDF8B|nr:AAA family ATPase [Cellulomonas sp. URHE0023]
MTRFRHGLVIGKFYPLHAGHLALVRSALARCDRVTVQVLGSSQESLTPEVRAGWLRAELPGAHVVAGMDDEPVDYASDHAWEVHVGVIRDLLDAPVDAVLTSDEYGGELARRLGATWVQVDPGRHQTPVSARAVRADPARYWWALPAAVRSWFVRRVVVLGAESTGTTTLANDLTSHFGLPTIPEFGREWTHLRPGGPSAPWHTADFELVAREQARREDAAATLTPVPLLVADTDVLVTAVFHERHVGTWSPTVAAIAASRVPDLYLLTGDEIPYEHDDTRDGEHLRHAMQERFRGLLDQQPSPWVELRGSRAERFAAAVALVEPLLAEPRRLADPAVERNAHVSWTGA